MKSYSPKTPLLFPLLLAWLSLVSAGGALGDQSPLTFADLLQDLARREGVTWNAVDHPIAHLTTSPVTLGGLVEENPPTFGQAMALYQRRDRRHDTPLPMSLDWRNFGSVNYLPPMREAQGNCGSCVAFAAMATLESTLMIHCDSPHRPFHFSRQYFFSCGGGACRGGWRMSEAMSFLENHGTTDDACFAYEAAGGEDIPCSAACGDAQSRRFKDVSFQRPTAGFVEINKIKEALRLGPLLANMILFEDLQYYQSGVYRHVSGRQLGSHAVVLVGWDDADRAWIVRNSWGPTWGDGGYFKAAYDDVDVLLGRYTWQMVIPEGSGCELAR